MTTSSSPGVLVAILLNPPASTPGTRTRNAVERAARVLGYESVEIANLCPRATSTVVELNTVEHRQEWLEGRDDLARALRRASSLLAGWGVSGMTGDAGRARQSQVEWLLNEAVDMGFDNVWMVGGQPRHPSRWHQYVSDKHGRTSGGTLEERLAEVLQAVPIPRDDGGSSAKPGPRQERTQPIEYGAAHSNPNTGGEVARPHAPRAATRLSSRRA
jgi:hypothetical protein